MPTMKEKKIKTINYYACGYCVNKLKYVIKKPEQKKKNFYAGVFLINHEKYGNILFDTGYSNRIYKCGIVGKIYNLFNPTYIKDDETIIEQLKRENINVDSINYVILSHLHPDHIGCVKDFSNAKFIVSKDCFNEYEKGKVKSLIFKKMLPEDFENKVIIIDEYNENFENFKGNDFFKDGSIILTQIDGHFNGQICAYIPEHKVLIAADACWGLKFQDRVDEMHPFARMVQNNFVKYKSGIENLKKIEKDGVSVYFSHDDYNKKELI